MKFSKKLLTALLPITAAGALAPVLSSCNKGNGYTINYGDEINCLDEKATNYHSLNDVKNAVKNHVFIDDTPTIGITTFINLTSKENGRQMIYFDLIANLAIQNDVKFHLTCDKGSGKGSYSYKLVYMKDGQQVTAPEGVLGYGRDSNGTALIFLANQVTFKSYIFQNTEIVLA